MRDFVHRYPWTVAFLILFCAMLLGFLRVQSIQDDVSADRDARTAENLRKDRQFCIGIPNTAESVAQALVNILVADLRENGGSAKEINDLLDLGRRYTDEARQLALSNLPACPKILGG